MFYDYIALAYPSRPIQRQVATCYRAVGESGDAVGFILAVVTVDNHSVTPLNMDGIMSITFDLSENPNLFLTSFSISSKAFI